MNDDEKLIQYLIKQGKKFGLSAVEFAKRFYKNTDFFKYLEKQNYFKDYYKNNKEKYVENAKKHEGKFIYLLVSENDEVVYVGSTITSLYNRIQWHKSMKRDFQKVIYYDLTNTELKANEIRQLEYFLQNLYKEHLVDCTVHPYKEDEIKDILDIFEGIKAQVINGYRIKDELARVVPHPIRIRDILLKFGRRK
ncbi:MAG: GIY-YIG nuclease family protein [Romboutsia timonensis]